MWADAATAHHRRCSVSQWWQGQVPLATCSHAACMGPLVHPSQPGAVSVAGHHLCEPAYQQNHSVHHLGRPGAMAPLAMCVHRCSTLLTPLQGSF